MIFSFIGIICLIFLKIINMDYYQSLWNEEFEELKITPDKKKGIRCTTSYFSVNDNNKRGFSRENGEYFSIGFDRNRLGKREFERELTRQSTAILSRLLKGSKVLIVGLGNQKVTADSLGPEVIDVLAKKRNTLLLCKTSVFGLTGIESYTIVKGLSKELAPSSIICLDSLTCSAEKNLYSSIQITNAGLIPGSGLGNDRPPINEKSIGVPVISIGVPLIARSPFSTMCVTPKEIDIIVQLFSHIIGEIIFKGTKKE